MVLSVKVGYTPLERSGRTEVNGPTHSWRKVRGLVQRTFSERRLCVCVVVGTVDADMPAVALQVHAHTSLFYCFAPFVALRRG